MAEVQLKENQGKAEVQMGVRAGIEHLGGDIGRRLTDVLEKLINW